MKRQLPTMSVAIACFNGGATIGRTLDSLMAQTYPKDKVQLIVVDDGSTDNTSEIAARYPVTILRHNQNLGTPAARNTSLSAVTGDIYVCMDDDAMAAPDMLAKLAEAYSLPNPAGIASLLVEPAHLHGLVDNYMAGAGSGRPPSIKLSVRKSPLQRLWAYVTDQARPLPKAPDKPYPVACIYGASSSFPMSVLQAVGGWDASLHGVEDSEICHRISQQLPGLTFYAQPDAKLVHDPKMSLRTLMRRAFKRGPANLAYYRKHKLIPPVFPFPVLWIGGSLSLLLVSPLLSLAYAAASPLVLYFWWLHKAVRERRPIYAAIPYVQLGEETAAMAGLVRGYVRLFVPFISVTGTKRAIRHARHMFHTDSLFRNAIYLMASTGIMSALGFGFWLFLAHFYSPANIGTASALMAIAQLVSNLSYLGLNLGLVRFLPSSKHSSNDINAALVTVGGASALIAAFYVVFHLGTNIAFFSTNIWTEVLFVFLMAVVVLNSLTDNVFIANRRAELHTITYAVLGLVKLILPIALIKYGALGIYMGYTSACFVSLLLSFYLMARGCGYHFFRRPNWRFIKSSRKFTMNNYFGATVSTMSPQILPTLIIWKLGADSAAYFSMAWTMANLIYTVPAAVTNSLLAESSSNTGGRDANLARANRILIAILTPVVILAVIAAPVALRIFGPQYEAHSTLLFQMLIIGTFFISWNSVKNTQLNIEHRTIRVVIAQSAVAIMTLTLSWFLIRYGLTGIAIAMLAGNMFGSLVQVIYGFLDRRHRPALKARALPNAEPLAD